jgi:predicted TIM-barrel fold metal-dependent hydrolase
MEQQAEQWLDEIKIIDVDTHYTEPRDLWTSRATGDLKSRVPRVEEIDGVPTWVIDGVSMGFASGYGTVRPDGSKVDLDGFFSLSIDEIITAGWNPDDRLKLMDEIGVYAHVLYPNMAGFGGEAFAGISDASLKIACVRIYNDAMAEMQEGSNGRLLPMSIVPWWDVAATVEETRRVADMGSRGIVMCTDPHLRGTPDLAHDAWNPFWEACIENELPVNFHIGASSSGIASFWTNPWESMGRAANMTVTSPVLFLNNCKIILNMTMGGVLERHPDLNIVSVESGTGWVPFLMEAIDHQHNEEVAAGKPILRKAPSEYIREQVYTCFFFERIRPELFDSMNVGNVMFETDFPHPVCLYPEHKKAIYENLADLPMDTRRKLLRDNAARLYKIDVG